MNAAPGRAEAIEAFLERRTFHCPKLRACLTVKSCAERQTRFLEHGGYTSGNKGDERTPQNLYCQSGLCVLGIRNLNSATLRKRAA